MCKNYLAIDIGASSGRHLLKTENQIIEIYRFKNFVDQTKDGLTWDISRLFNEIIKGIEIAYQKYDLDMIGIDTWGCDYVLLDHNDDVILPVYAYRNDRTKTYIDEVHKKISVSKLYEITGSQFQSFNTIYQLYTDHKNNRLQKAAQFLMLPEYFFFLLTDTKFHEYTNATTTGLIDIKTKSYSKEIIDKLGFDQDIFYKPINPGYRTKLKSKYQKNKDSQTEVVLVATHDTASAVHGVSIPDESLYLSSGTWSLLGIKTQKIYLNESARLHNFSHEGGVGYHRFQKNIMGLWIIQKLQSEFNYPNITDVINLVEGCSYNYTIDINDERLISPSSMKDTISDILIEEHIEKPKKDCEYFNLVYHSLASSYHQTITEIEEITHQSYSKIYVFGGGAKNNYLNKLIESYTHKKVIALPIEATAIGNIKIMEDLFYE
jgi:rhamnulokinase